MNPSAFGKWLLVAGLLVLITVAITSVFGKLPLIGRLPGDLVIRREHTVIYLPITSCLLASISLTMLIKLLRS